MVLTSARMVDGLQVQVMRDETELEAVRRARDSILANISHEFRTPLAAQLASIELLQENLHGLSREQLEELVASLQRGTLRLTRLIDNLLESVRIESGQLGIRQQSIHLSDVVQDAAELVASLLAQRGQWLEIDVPGRPAGHRRRRAPADAGVRQPARQREQVRARRQRHPRRRARQCDGTRARPGSRMKAPVSSKTSAARSSSASIAPPTRSRSRAVSASACGS